MEISISKTLKCTDPYAHIFAMERDMGRAHEPLEFDQVS